MIALIEIGIVVVLVAGLLASSFRVLRAGCVLTPERAERRTQNVEPRTVVTAEPGPSPV